MITCEEMTRAAGPTIGQYLVDFATTLLMDNCTDRELELNSSTRIRITDFKSVFVFRNDICYFVCTVDACLFLDAGKIDILRTWALPGSVGKLFSRLCSWFWSLKLSLETWWRIKRICKVLKSFAIIVESYAENCRFSAGKITVDKNRVKKKI